jgi:hypothetical protein
MADPVPHAVRALADERARARRARDWATADRLKAELEAAGWRVVDAATLYSLEPLPPAVVEVEGQVRYGSSEAVPSMLDTPPLAPATVVLVAEDDAGCIPGAIEAVRVGSPEAQVVVVANSPSAAVAGELAALRGVEVVPLARRLGAAAARNAGIRRAAGSVVVLLDPRVVAEGDLVGELASALADPGVGVAGVRGLATADLVHFAPAAPGEGPAVAVDRLAVAFRRADFVARGPLDEHYTLEDYLDVWWSLTLRDVPEDAEFGVDLPRRAAVVETAYRLVGAERPESDERLAKKHRYRFLKSFASRRDLLAPR